MLDEEARNPLNLTWHELVGKRVLVALTVHDTGGKVVEQRQVHGRMAAADARVGLTLALEGAQAGETCVLPPDLRSFKPAPTGEYRLKSTGEVIRDPDYLATWIVEQLEDDAP